MDSTTIIVAMILVCVGILMFMAFSGPIKAVIRILLGALIGMAGIYALNVFFPAINIGINPITAAITGILGVPGFAALIVAGLVL